MARQHETMEGCLTRIIFKNESGFIIGLFTSEHNNRFTALGSMINPQVNLNYIFEGYWTKDHKYGEQFKFHSHEVVMPVDSTGLFKYIVRVCKFVGPSTGNAIIDKFGKRTLEVMKNEPERLSNVIKTITLDRALGIQKVLLENEKVEKLMIQLEKMLDIPGMRKDVQGKLIKEYKSNAVEILKKNPYILTSFAGVGFSLADRVALHIGFGRDHIERKIAVAVHCLKENSNNGSVWISKKNLLFEIESLIQVNDVAAGIHALVMGGDVVKRNGFYSIKAMADDESLIAEVLMTLRTS